MACTPSPPPVCHHAAWCKKAGPTGHGNPPQLATRADRSSCSMFMFDPSPSMLCPYLWRWARCRSGDQGDGRTGVVNEGEARSVPKYSEVRENDQAQPAVRGNLLLSLPRVDLDCEVSCSGRHIISESRRHRRLEDCSSSAVNLTRPPRSCAELGSPL